MEHLSYSPEMKNLRKNMVTLTFDLLTPKSIGFLPFPIPSTCISFVSIGQGILKLSSGNEIWNDGMTEWRKDGKANSIVPRFRERRGTKINWKKHICSEMVHTFNIPYGRINKYIDQIYMTLKVSCYPFFLHKIKK